MKDFNDNDLETGDTVFFNHRMSQQVIGKISGTKGKKTILIEHYDVIKGSPILMDNIKAFTTRNPNSSYGLVVLSTKTIKI